MSSDAVIRTAGLGKAYGIHHQASRPGYLSLRDELARGITEILRGRWGSNTREEFWALRDLDIEIRAGDRVGVIGRNGAGKSTLLKLLSRITEPSAGSIRIRGRVASMLEVGTGFHPELTGRENIFLSGAILGMRRAEVARRFDEIVAFADVERFLDTPIKHYSSGMYLRLAFSVAAHIEPDVLIVDEVLAVGDAQFQQKCLGGMEKAGREGRTVLFVSHNMAAIEGLCSRAMVLEGGRLIAEGAVREQIAFYLGSILSRGASLQSPLDLGNGRVERLELDPNPVESGSGLRFFLEVRARGEPLDVEALTIMFDSPLGALVGVLDLRGAEPYRVNPAQPLKLSGAVQSVPLVEGDYGVGLFIKGGGAEFTRRGLLSLHVAPKPVTGAVIPYRPGIRGVVEFQSTFASTNSAP